MLKIINMQDLKNYLQLVKLPSLLIGLLFIIKFALFPSTGAATTLGQGAFLLLVISLSFIGIGGFLINDIHSVKSDRVNYPDKPLANGSIAIKTAYILYTAFTSIGIVIGAYVCYSIGFSSYAMLIVALAAIPYLYATGLKNTGVLGNFLLASLAFVAFIILGILDLMPAINPTNQVLQAKLFKILLLYGGFGFAFTYIQTILIDLHNLAGDRKIGNRTIAVQLGLKATKKVLSIACIMLFLALLFCIYYFIEENKLLTYFVLAVIAPFIYFIIQLFYLEKEHMVNQIKVLLNILKIVSTAGIISLLLLNYF